MKKMCATLDNIQKYKCDCNICLMTCVHFINNDKTQNNLGLLVYKFIISTEVLQNEQHKIIPH